MNKHIELVKKWLDDPDSVTKEELKDNADAAVAVADAVADAAAADAADAVAEADYAGAFADAANADAVDAYAKYTARCVKKYEELIEEKGNEN